MTKQVQRRRGTATQHTSFTGAEGEVSVNTTNKSVHVHDGVTAGGIEGARADLTNVSDSDLNARLTGNTLSSLTITSADINGGTIDGTVIGGTTPAAGSFTTGSFTGNATFGDNDKAIFGAGSDLQIYHDGSNSYVKDAGDGVLNVQGSSQVNIGGANGTIGVQFVEGANVTLRHNNSPKLATTSTGIDVTGTVTADGLTVDGAATLSGQLRFNDTNYWIDNSGGSDISYRSGGTHQFYSGGFVQRLNIASNGDISFYEDTGTTPKFFWDASAESLSIGTTGVVSTLTSIAQMQVTGDQGGLVINSNLTGSDSYGRLVFTQGGATGNEGLIRYNNNNYHMSFWTDAAERMRIDSSGNVGIGTSSPSRALHVSGGSTLAQFQSSTTGVYLELKNSGGNAAYIGSTSGSNLVVETGGSEAMRIDSSGNLLVGTTVTPNTLAGASATQGVAVNGSTGYLVAAASGTATAYFNRQTSDGNIAEFRKDGSTVGSIGVVSSTNFYINSGDTGLGFRSSADDIVPVSSGGSGRDNAIDLGDPSFRFDDVYATNGTIQTSDRNEKQDIEALSDAEQRVAVACKGLLRKFRWKDAVAEKGDDARIHFGIIAQDLQDAFAAEGLDAGDYAMFISTTWTDEETGEERTRMGVRYSELLAFIIAAI